VNKLGRARAVNAAWLDAPVRPAYPLPSMIRLHEVRFAYPGGLPALRGIALTIAPGEHVAVVGTNGSGKTTLARCLNGLLTPQQGTVEVDELDTARPEHLPRLRELVGMVFQNPDDQLVATSVETEIAFGLENLGVPLAAMRERVDAALREFDLEAYRRHPPHQLSGGQKQRVAVAATMVLRPRYLVLDEPTSLLDPRSRTRVLALLHDLPARFGTALVHITQSPEEAAQAERVVVLHQGRVHADAPPAVLFARPEALESIGLGLPFAAALHQALQRRGVELPLPDGRAPTEELLRRQLRGRAARWPEGPRSGAAPAAGPAKLATRDLSYTYDRGLPTQQPGLDAVSIDVPAGRVMAVLGTSGAGKSTLAQHLNGLLRPDRGSVLLDGTDIRQQALPRVRQRVGLVFQFPELQLFAETVAADVAYGPANLGWPADRVAASVRQALEAVGLPPDRFGARSPLQLSGGEKRRAALAGILAMEPEVLVLDEPTVGLDPGATRAMLAVFARLVGSGKTLVLITHDMDVVADLADEVVVLRTGRVVMAGDTRRVLSQPDFAANSGLEAPWPMRFAQSLAADAGEAGEAGPWPLTLAELAAALAAGSREAT
jgi:energy-coupling factor transport system ATP-binding protein